MTKQEIKARIEELKERVNVDAEELGKLILELERLEEETTSPQLLLG